MADSKASFASRIIVTAQNLGPWKKDYVMPRARLPGGPENEEWLRRIGAIADFPDDAAPPYPQPEVQATHPFFTQPNPPEAPPARVIPSAPAGGAGDAPAAPPSPKAAGA